MSEQEKPNIKMSTASKTRKSLTYLQNKKKKGEKIVQVCPAELGPIFALGAELADCDIFRIPALLSQPTCATPETDIVAAGLTIQKYRTYSQIMHMNFYMPMASYCNKSDAVKYGAIWTYNGADSMLPMGITNETLKYMSDNYVPTYGHIGAVSGWQTNATGYKRMGKTAEEAFAVYKWGYEYQENGMGGMTIELVPVEVANAIAKKLRVPVLGIAAGAACDGSEMVDMDTFGMMPSAAAHAKTYAQLLPFMIGAYSAWANDVRSGAYPDESKNGFHMDPAELEKFNTMMENV